MLVVDNVVFIVHCSLIFGRCMYNNYDIWYKNALLLLIDLSLYLSICVSGGLFTLCFAQG